MLLIAPVLILWMQIPREFGVSLIASREFCTVKYYLQETVRMRFSDSRMLRETQKLKSGKMEGVGQGDMERRRKIHKKNERPLELRE